MFEREVNKNSITESEIVVIIPSFKEADSIAHPTKIASEGLIKYFPDKKSVIINADNASPDNTEKVFLDTQTEVPKIYITTPSNTPGKGWNFANAFRKSLSLGAKTIICVDADLISITPEWIKYMAEPIYKGYDYLTPVYSRHKYDGTITNNICYPLIYGIFCQDIRQPIGGDFALSGRLASHLIQQPWHRTTHEYGIDIFMTMNALLGDFKIAQVGLGSKIHKPSAPKLGPMFIQVVGTAFLTIANNFNKWKDLKSVSKAPIFGLQELAPAQDLQVDRNKIRENAITGFQSSIGELKQILAPKTMDRLEKTFADPKGPVIDTNFWVDIFFDMIAAFPKHKQTDVLVDSMKGLWFGRVFTFMNDTWDLSSSECEAPIREQGECVFQRRNELVKMLEQG